MNTPTSHHDLAIGIDVGGTAIKAGLVDRAGQVFDSRTIPTQADQGADAGLQRIAELARDLQNTAQSQNARVIGIGLGMPGTLDHKQGIVIAPPNLPGWINVPVVRRINTLTEFPVLLDNDANNAALGEFFCGVGRDVRSLFMITLGTGIGGGIVLDGKVSRGLLGNAGEIGHMIIEPNGRLCGCGQHGCLEAYASANATVARFIQEIKNGGDSILRAHVESQDGISVEQIIEAATSGDSVAMQVWDQTCRLLAVACINVHHLLNIKMIVLGGGMSRAGSRLLEPVQRHIAELASTSMGGPPRIELATLGNDAGFIGAGLNAFASGLDIIATDSAR